MFKRLRRAVYGGVLSAILFGSFALVATVVSAPSVLGFTFIAASVLATLKLITIGTFALGTLLDFIFPSRGL